ncbi:MAG: DNA recombination protein RecO [Gammaproteobacteria bacterium]|nr:MAG: DNA recombination protein RecO [Gammaproteobacteria bacterium]
MRNEPLTGYLIHHKPYQESRALYYFFTQTHGVVHGIGKKGMPLFAHIQLFANGKRSLKTFTQIQPLAPQVAITGQNLYAGFYLNELLWKLLANEDAMPILWQNYQQSLTALRETLNNTQLRVLLRFFEQALFAELGYVITLDTDSQGEPIKQEQTYRFIADEGFVSYVASQKEEPTVFAVSSIFCGKWLQQINDYLQNYYHQFNTQKNYHKQAIETDTLKAWSRLHKLMIDYLLDYQPLQSRVLWQQQARYR